MMLGSLRLRTISSRPVVRQSTGSPGRLAELDGQPRAAIVVCSSILATMADVSAATETATGDLAGDIGRRLALHRGRRGMRVAELAREVGVTPSLISQIERGQSRPSVSTLFALAQALDVPVDAFFREPAADAPHAAALPGGDPGADGPGPGRAGGADAGGADTGGAGASGAGAGGPGAGAAGAALEAGADQQAAPAGAGLPSAASRYVVRRGNRAAIDIDGGVRWERLTPETLGHLDFFELVYAPGAESNPTLYSHPGTEMVLVLTGSMQISVGFETYWLEPGDSMQFPSSVPHRYANPGTVTARAVTVILYDCPADPVQPGHLQARHPGVR